MAAPNADRRQQQNTNLLLMLLVFNFAFLYFMNQQKQTPKPPSGRPPAIPTAVCKAIEVGHLSPSAAKTEAVKLVRQAQEFNADDDFAGYAWLRAGVLVADRLDESAAAEVYNVAFPPRNEGGKVNSYDPKQAASQLMNVVLKQHSKSRFAAQASLEQARVLTPPGKIIPGTLSGEAVSAWETARTDKQLLAKPVYLGHDGNCSQTNLEDEACTQLDAAYRTGLLYRWLDFLVSLTGRHRHFSYALAVILFGIAVKIAMYPLTHKQMESFKAMAELSPQIQAIQNKYKDSTDPEKLQKMNKEMSGVYRNAGANPMVGCLLIALQMPIFIFMYQAISHYQCQFRNASFLWIPSLGQPDTTLLILYTVSMILQGLTMQKPTTDPQQAMTQKMMTWFMPIFFAVMMFSWHFPSAFAIYWLTFNVFAIVQQWIMMNPSDRDRFSIRRHGAGAVVKRLISPGPPPEPNQPAAGKPVRPTNEPTPAAGAENGSDRKPRPRRGKRGRKK